jgi:hypothetical protein
MNTLNTNRTVTVLMTALMLSGAMTSCKKKKEVVTDTPPLGGNRDQGDVLGSRVLYQRQGFPPERGG